MPYGPNISDWPGTRYFWDPNRAADDGDGLTIATADKLFATVYARLTAGQGDHVVWVDPGGTTQATFTTAITLSKDCTALFGPGASMAKLTTAAAADAVTISGQDCLIKGFEITTTASGDDCCLISADGANVIECLFSASVDESVVVSSANRANVESCFFGDALGDGVQAFDADDLTLRNCRFYAGGHGVNLTGASLRAWIENCLFQGITLFGVRIAGTSDDAVIKGCVFRGNTTDIDNDRDSTAIIDTYYSTIDHDGTNLIQSAGGVRTDKGIPLATVSGPLQGGS